MKYLIPRVKPIFFTARRETWLAGSPLTSIEESNADGKKEEQQPGY